MRGFMLDSARCLESRAYYRCFIDFAARRGCDTLLWHFTDDQGCSLRFDCLREAASPNAYTKDELAELIAYARSRGITVIPELETLGHTRYITRNSAEHARLAENDKEFTSLCPVAPGTREVVGQLLDETAELFDAPVVHVGLDEVNFGDHPLTQQALASRSRSELFADHVRFLHQRLGKHGRRLMMWGDHLLKDPSIAEAIPKDILVCNWQYAPGAPVETTERLLGWGFEVVVCPALISHDQPLFPGEAFALPNLRDVARHRGAGDSVLGTLTTVWTPQRFMHDTLWPGLHVAAEIMDQGADVDLRASLARFAETFHGLAAPASWLDAMAELFEHAPMRKQWLAVLRLEPVPGWSASDLSGRAQAWQRVHGVLAEQRDGIRREADRYDTLLLMVEVLAHAYERAAAAAEGAVNETLRQAAERLGKRVAEVWDHERFADDPRKREPVFAFDEGNHLLVVFEQGTRALSAGVGAS